MLCIRYRIYEIYEMSSSSALFVATLTGRLSSFQASNVRGRSYTVSHIAETSLRLLSTSGFKEILREK
jgi:gamma-glutamyltranspeptidase